MESDMVISIKITNAPALWLSNSPSWFYPTDIFMQHKIIYAPGYSLSCCLEAWEQPKCPKIEDSLRRLYYPYNRILWSHTKGWKSSLCSSWEQFPRYIVRWKITCHHLCFFKKRGWSRGRICVISICVQTVSGRWGKWGAAGEGDGGKETLMSK